MGTGLDFKFTSPLAGWNWKASILQLYKNISKQWEGTHKWKKMCLKTRIRDEAFLLIIVFLTDVNTAQ